MINVNWFHTSKPLAPYGLMAEFAPRYFISSSVFEWSPEMRARSQLAMLSDFTVTVKRLYETPQSCLESYSALLQLDTISTDTRWEETPRSSDTSLAVPWFRFATASARAPSVILRPRLATEQAYAAAYSAWASTCEKSADGHFIPPELLTAGVSPADPGAQIDADVLNAIREFVEPS